MRCPICGKPFAATMNKVDLGYVAEDNTDAIPSTIEVTYKHLFYQLCPSCKGPLVFYKESKGKYLVRWNAAWFEGKQQDHSDEPIRMKLSDPKEQTELLQPLV